MVHRSVAQTSAELTFDACACDVPTYVAQSSPGSTQQGLTCEMLSCCRVPSALRTAGRMARRSPIRSFVLDRTQFQWC
jgi:hypothetical protein